MPFDKVNLLNIYRYSKEGLKIIRDSLRNWKDLDKKWITC